MIVDVEKLKETFEYQLKINREQLENIVWMRDGKVVKPTDDMIEEFKFIGLSNCSFPTFAGILE